MNWEAIGAIGEAIGAIAVIATLIYLAIQIRQNTESVRANSYQSWMSANLQIGTAMSNQYQSNVVGAAIFDSRNLKSESEAVAFGMLYISVFQTAQSIDYLYKSGSLDENLWRAEMSRTAGLLGMPGVRQWWDGGGKTQLTPEFAKFIESYEPDILYWNWTKERGYFSSNEL